MRIPKLSSRAVSSVWLMTTFFILLHSCQGDPNSSSQVELRTPSQKAFPHAGHVYNPRKIALIDNKLVVFDDVSEGFFKVYVTDAQPRLLSAWGNLSQNRLEGFGNVDVESVNKFGNQIGFLDYPVYRSFTVDGAGAFTVIDSCYFSTQDYDLNSVVKYGSGKYLVQPPVSYDAELPSFYAIDCGDFRQPTTKIGRLPEYENLSFASPIDAYYFYFKYVFAHPSGKWATFYRHFDRAEFYSAQHELLRTENTTGEILPATTSQERKICYVGGCATDEAVYGLFMHDYEYRINEDPSTVQTELQKWSWDGELLARYDLQAPILSVAVDEATEVAYCLQFDEAEPIVTYLLQ